MINRLSIKRKAIGELMAASFIILIVSILGVVLYSESFSSFSSTQQGYQEKIIIEKELIEEKFNIPYTYQKDTDLIIAIHNYGVHEILIDYVYIDNTQHTVMQKVPSETVAWISVPFPGSGQHQIRVLTERTSFMEVVYTG